jgi:hypothetical protein
LLFPARQVVPSQQPVGQLAAVQAQMPLTQSWSAAHAAQAAPPLPHWPSVCCPTGTQAVPAQQPLEQLAAVQAQMPPTQSWSLPQAKHACPPAPQRASV